MPESIRRRVIARHAMVQSGEGEMVHVHVGDTVRIASEEELKNVHGKSMRARMYVEIEAEWLTAEFGNQSLVVSDIDIGAGGRTMVYVKTTTHGSSGAFADRFCKVKGARNRQCVTDSA